MNVILTIVLAVQMLSALAMIGLVMVIATWGNVPATLWGGDLAARFGALRIFLIGTAALVIGMAGTDLSEAPSGGPRWSAFSARSTQA